MKKRITYLLLLLSLTVFSQDKAEIKEFFWGKNDAYSAVNTIPEKWKNESAVIIYKYENHDYHNYRINVTYTSAIRKKVMLLDEAAVTDYSEFSFLDKVYSDKGYSRKEGANIFGVKIIKPNGSVVEIDVDKESKMVDDEKKIAISNLEVGDIIDYYLYSEEKFKSDGSTGFPQVERVLGESYPILNYKLNFVSENDFFLNFNSYNGAPQLKEVKADKSSDRKFELVATDIAKKESSRWLYPLVELPCYKFQVYFAKNGFDRNVAYAFLSEKEKIVKQTVSKEEVFKEYKNLYLPNHNYNSAFENPKKFLKETTYKSDEDKVRALYYNSRYLFFIRTIERSIAYEANVQKEYSYMFNGYNITFYSENDSVLRCCLPVYSGKNITEESITNKNPVSFETVFFISSYSKRSLYFLNNVFIIINTTPTPTSTKALIRKSELDKSKNISRITHIPTNSLVIYAQSTFGDVK